MEPLVNYYVKPKRSIGVATPMVLSFPNNSVIYLPSARWDCNQVQEMGLNHELEVSSSGIEFGLEPGTTVFCLAGEVKEYLRWYEAQRSLRKPPQSVALQPFEETA